MFAVVRTGGKQYRVAPGDKIVVEKLDGSAGDRITLGDVLLAGDGSDLRSTDGLTVAAEIVAQAKGEKVTVFKKRRRHNYRRKKGHRQQHTILKIVAIGDQKQSAGDAAPAKGAKKAKPAPQADQAQQAAGAPVNEQPTPNPAPDKPEQANPGGGAAAESEATDAPAKPKKAKAQSETASTKDAAPAKGGAKKAPKAK
jgi:large subunit ribosomal protein L21